MRRYSEKYEKYVLENSEAWKQKKREYDSNFRIIYGTLFCRLCRREGEAFHHHHLSYRNLGQESTEPDTDLCLLCRRCHERIHSSSAVTYSEAQEKVRRAIIVQGGPDACERVAKRREAILQLT